MQGRACSALVHRVPYHGAHPYVQPPHYCCIFAGVPIAALSFDPCHAVNNRGSLCGSVAVDKRWSCPQLLAPANATGRLLSRDRRVMTTEHAVLPSAAGCAAAQAPCRHPQARQQAWLPHTHHATPGCVCALQCPMGRSGMQRGQRPDCFAPCNGWSHGLMHGPPPALG